MMKMTARWALIAAAALLSACSSTESVLNPGLGAEDQTPAPPPPGLQAQPGSPGQPVTATALSGVRLQFAPIVGSTVAAVTPLSRRLSLRAREAQLKLVGSGDATATHVVRGYLSVLPEEGGSTIIYVWDIMDSSGNRLHRIQGQEKTAARAAPGADAWSAIPASTMETIGDRTMSELSGWLGALSS